MIYIYQNGGGGGSEKLIVLYFNFEKFKIFFNLRHTQSLIYIKRI